MCLDAARKEGRIGGRPPKLKPHQQQEIVTLVKQGKKTAADAARLFGVHPATVSRLLRRTWIESSTVLSVPLLPKPPARREREHVAPRGRAPRVDGPWRTRRPSGAAAASARRSPLQETSAMTTGPKPPPAGRVWCTRCGARPGVMRQLGEVLCRLCADSPDGDAAARRSQKS